MQKQSEATAIVPTWLPANNGKVLPRGAQTTETRLELAEATVRQVNRFGPVAGEFPQSWPGG